ncbi:DNA sulfur modification protein DndB [Aerosakkonema sp. BLCC-F183]|uniref:DNA sulfur modification protein DndB n=1 Tax=Aerosakkonema sp. BLCC-F183 TaxID=3342834 RepID=UPI0035B96BA9
MSEINSPISDAKDQIAQVLERLFAEYHRDKCYPGLSFEQGNRKMVQINVPAHELPTLLQAKPSSDNDPDSGKNRPEVEGHADEVKEYILKRVRNGKPWILGTLTANVAPDKIKLIELGRGICLVVIPRWVKLDITDGQHRKRAIHELIESSEAELIAENDFPITLVLEGNFNQCQTDFRDMAQTKQLDKSLLLSFGEFEGRVGITKNLINRVPMFLDKTEKIKDNPPTKKKLIYSINYIAKLVSCAFADEPNDDLQDYDVGTSSEALVNCLKQFFSECSQTQDIYEKSFEDLTVEEVGEFKETIILGRSVGLEVLGHLLYCAYDKDNECFEAEKVSQLAQLDWSRESNIWQGNVVIIDPRPKNPAKPYKISAGVNSIRIAVGMAKAHLGWI